MKAKTIVYDALYTYLENDSKLTSELEKLLMCFSLGALPINSLITLKMNGFQVVHFQ